MTYSANFIELHLEPKVPASYFAALNQIIALGAVKGLEELGNKASIIWPFGIAFGKTQAFSIETHAGFDGGAFADVTVTATNPRAVSFLTFDAGPFAEAIEREVKAWSGKIEKNPTAGPLAPVLEDYFDHLAFANAQVELLYPNEAVAAAGVLAGVDVWGRLSLRMEDGSVQEFSPEMMKGLRAAS